MARFCAGCGAAIGWFSRKKVTAPDGSIVLMCNGCAAANQEPSAAVKEGATEVPPLPWSPAELPDWFGTNPGPPAEASGIDPRDPNPYVARFRGAVARQARDEAWCASAVLAFLGEADTEVTAYYETDQPEGLPRVRGRLDDSSWTAWLVHPALDRDVSNVLAALTTAALRARLAQLGKARVRLNRKYRQDLATSSLVAARTFGWAARVLNVPSPEFYARSDVPGTLHDVLAEPRAVQAGSDLLSGWSPTELTFLCAKHLALHHPVLAIRGICPKAAELQVLFGAGLSIAEPARVPPGRFGLLTSATARALTPHLDKAARAQLESAVRGFWQSGRRADLPGWLSGAEFTANRAALLCCADLQAANRIVLAEQAEPRATETMADLLAFTVSAEHSALRNVLGIGIAPN